MLVELNKTNWRQFTTNVGLGDEMQFEGIGLCTEWGTVPDTSFTLPRSIDQLFWSGKQVGDDSTHRTFVDHGHTLHIWKDCGCDGVGGTEKDVEFFMNKYLD